jgi:SAM-dependent methyltransferase
MSDLAIFEWLQTSAGLALLAQAMGGDLSEQGRLRELERLRRLADPPQASAAYEIARLRLRGQAKFPEAARMFFTREALEQSSGWVVGSYRARRYAGVGRVADLCCGIGGDALALAARAETGAVVAVDRDPLRLAMAGANAAALGLSERITTAQLDLELSPPPSADAIFFDPSRRSDGRRVFALAQYQPSVLRARDWLEATPAIGIKLAPGVAHADLEPLGPAELEFISVRGELKEAVIWLGELARPGVRATILESAADSSHPIAQSRFLERGGEMPRVPVAAPGAFLYEPDPAIIRAGLVTLLAEELGAAQIDREIAYLTADRAIATPFARCWRILEALPFALKRVQARLRALDAGPVTVKKRGSPLETDALARKLSGGGARALALVLTFAAGRPTALICEGPLTGLQGL